MSDTNIINPPTGPITPLPDTTTPQTTPQGTKQTPPTTPKTTDGDLDGTNKQPLTLTAPNLSHTPSTESEIQNALDSLERKSPEVLKAVSEALAAMVALNPSLGGKFNISVLEGLIESVINGAKDNKGAPFNALYAYLSEGLDEILAAMPENQNLKVLGESVRNILDLLKKPDSAETRKAITAELANLAKLAGGEDKFAAAMAAALYNVLSVTSEADMLGDKLTNILRNINTFIPNLIGLAAATVASQKAVTAALSGLLAILSASIQQEVAIRMQTTEEELKSQETLRQKESEHKRTMKADALKETEFEQTQFISSSAVVSALSQGGDEGYRIINALILKLQANSVPRSPV